VKEKKVLKAIDDKLAKASNKVLKAIDG